MDDLETSLLDTLPASVQLLGSALTDGRVWIMAEYDPVESLFDRLDRFKDLKKLPMIVYDTNEDFKRTLPATKELLLEHFDNFIESTQKERDEFLKQYGFPWEPYLCDP